MRLLERALPLIWIIWPWEETSVSQSQSGRFLLSSSRMTTALFCWARSCLIRPILRSKTAFCFSSSASLATTFSSFFFSAWAVWSRSLSWLIILFWRKKAAARTAMRSRMKIEVRGKAFLALHSGPGAAGPSLNSLLSGLRRLIRIMLLFHFPGGESDGYAEEGSHLLRINGVELLLVESHAPERIERLRLDAELLFEGLGDVL